VHSRIFALAVVFLLFAASYAQADSLYGKCVYKDGSKAGGEIGISTSWNGKKGYPRNGRYTLDFGKRVGATITVYVKGKSVGRVKVSGKTRFDIVVP